MQSTLVKSGFMCFNITSSETSKRLNDVDTAINKSGNHPSIITITETIDIGLTFSSLYIFDNAKIIKALNSNKWQTTNKHMQ